MYERTVDERSLASTSGVLQLLGKDILLARILHTVHKDEVSVLNLNLPYAKQERWYADMLDNL